MPILKLIAAVEDATDRIEGALLEVNSSIEQLTEVIVKGIEDEKKT